MKLSNRLKIDISFGAMYNMSFRGSVDNSSATINYSGSFAVNNTGYVYREDGNYNFRYDAESYDGDDQAFIANDFPDFFGSGVKATNNNTSFKLNSAISLFVKPTLLIDLNPNISLGLGIQYINGIFNSSDLSKSRKFYLTHRKGEYNTMMDSFEKINYQNVVVSLGIRYTIAK
jgi:hypothetical protein